MNHIEHYLLIIDEENSICDFYELSFFVYNSPKILGECFELEVGSAAKATTAPTDHALIKSFPIRFFVLEN